MRSNRSVVTRPSEWNGEGKERAIPKGHIENLEDNRLFISLSVMMYTPVGVYIYQNLSECSVETAYFISIIPQYNCS